MSGQLKISLLLLAGVTVILGTQVTTSFTPSSATSQSNQILSPNDLDAQTSNPTLQNQRENYTPIPLSKITDAHVLIGNDPKAIALAAIGNLQSQGSFQNLIVDYPQPNQSVVTITQTRRPDDSVSGIRYRVELQRSLSLQSSNLWQIVGIGSQSKCHPGRGHQDWSTELCL